MSSNIYDLLSNDEAHSKRPQEKELPGKPDKSDQRRSAPRGGAAAGRGGASAAGESRPQSSRARVDDRDRRGGRGGSRGGRGGRGGYHGTESDGVHRNFDRKQGEHTRHAPGEARKHGAVGEVDPTHFAGSASEFAAQDAAQVAESNADIVADEILDITPMPTDPDDAKLTYDEYLAQRARPDDDVNRQTREVSEDQGSEFKAVKLFKKVEESIFGEPIEATKEEKASTGASSKANKKKAKISLDEFVGERPAPASSSSERGGRGGASSGRGGRGGFQGESRGGRGGAGAPRGGRGGFDGPRGAPRGGRGGARAPAANVNLADQSAFPALSPK